VADEETTDTVAHATDALYAAAPDDFMTLRAELATQARTSGDPIAAKSIAALRKPTVSASIVNRLVHDDPSSVERLADLSARLREAHDALDAAVLRDLSGERRALVGELTRAALDHAGQRNSSAAVRDEVIATFDAAVADPDVANRLGRLTRSAHWSGFGFPVTGSPELTLVRGGRDTSRRSTRPARPEQPTRPDTSEAPAPRIPSAVQRKNERARDLAQSTFDAADAAFRTAESEERAGTEHIRALTAELTELQRSLEQARRDLDQSRREVRSARAKRREARSALDRAERKLSD
jgi:hypothetical protein